MLKRRLEEKAYEYLTNSPGGRGRGEKERERGGGSAKLRRRRVLFDVPLLLAGPVESFNYSRLTSTSNWPVCGRWRTFYGRIRMRPVSGNRVLNLEILSLSPVPAAFPVWRGLNFYNFEDRFFPTPLFRLSRRGIFFSLDELQLEVRISTKPPRSRNSVNGTLRISIKHLA